MCTFCRCMYVCMGRYMHVYLYVKYRKYKTCSQSKNMALVCRGFQSLDLMLWKEEALLPLNECDILSHSSLSESESHKPPGFFTPVTSQIATSVQKGCKWENSNLRKTMFIVQRHKRNTNNILLQTVTTFEQAYVIPTGCPVVPHFPHFPHFQNCVHI